ncbi:hypothetical protein B0A54_03518 [Friedmanniomyces endolithicus]|uniref:Uncharacterized protein n=1 Tax=Friedmanniomyces endolithicus TaxID=329885 RepID=A0A4U0VAW2_9PEZI|nr:hypothetical protein B0A54_03518 [Friedmanniomyces endolithicus]
MVKAKTRDVILKVRVYAGRDDLLKKQDVRVDSTTAVLGLSDALHETIVSVIRDTNHSDFAKKRNGKHNFQYDIGFRFAQSPSSFRGYTHGIDTYPELNIEPLADLFPEPSKPGNVIDVVVNIEVEKRSGGSKKVSAGDWTQTIGPSYALLTYDYFRLGISPGSEEKRDISKKEANTLWASVDAAKREKTIATYDALLAWRRSGERGLPGQWLFPVSVHDFGDVCFGDCNRSEYAVPGSHRQHIYLDYFEWFNREGTLQDLKKKVLKYAGLQTPSQVGSGLPLLPSYTWTDLDCGPAFNSAKWPKGGVKLAIHFVSRMPGMPKLVFPQKLTLAIVNDDEDEAGIVHAAAIGAMKKCPKPKPIEDEAERESCRILLDRKFRDEWVMQIWAVQQDPAPRKLHLWAPHGDTELDDGKMITNFGLLNCLSVAKAREGDSRVFLQAVIGPKDTDSWLVTGTEYTKHKAEDGRKESKKEQKKNMKRQKPKAKERKGKKQEDDEDEDAELEDQEDEDVEEEDAEEEAQGKGGVEGGDEEEEEEEREEEEEKEEENAHAKSGKRRSGNAFSLSKRFLTEAVLRKSVR